MRRKGQSCTPCGRNFSKFLQTLVQPGTASTQRRSAARRVTPSLGCLLVRQAGKVTQLDKLCSLQIVLFQFGERVIEGNKGYRPVRR